MSLPPRTSRPAPSRRPGSRVLGAAAAALGTLLALAAWVVSQAGVAQAASPWPSGHGAQVRERMWIPAPVTGTLRPGMRGTAVRRLQQRLAQLHYDPGPVNGRFGTDTLEAVWAFKEVQGLPTAAGADDVDPVMQRALGRPRPPSVLVPQGGGLRIEVNLPREVLVLYRHHQVQLISHISAGGGYYYRCPGGGTCGPALTPDGNYRAHCVRRGLAARPAGPDVQPGVLHRHELRHPRRHPHPARARFPRLRAGARGRGRRAVPADQDQPGPRDAHLHPGPGARNAGPRAPARPARPRRHGGPGPDGHARAPGHGQSRADQAPRGPGSRLAALAPGTGLAYSAARVARRPAGPARGAADGRVLRSR